MGELILSLLPLMIAGALTPTWISLVVILVHAPNGTARALGFVGAMTAVRLLQGLGGDQIFEEISARLDLSFWLPVLLTCAGVLLLYAGLRLLLKRGPHPGVPDRLSRFAENAGVTKCALLGTVLILTSPRQWIVTSSAIVLIEHAGVARLEALIAFLVFIAGAGSLILAPIVWNRRGGRREVRTPGRVTSFARRHGRLVSGAVSICVGAFFLWHGVSQL